MTASSCVAFDYVSKPALNTQSWKYLRDASALAGATGLYGNPTEPGRRLAPPVPSVRRSRRQIDGLELCEIAMGFLEHYFLMHSAHLDNP